MIIQCADLYRPRLIDKLMVGQSDQKTKSRKQIEEVIASLVESPFCCEDKSPIWRKEISLAQCVGLVTIVKRQENFANLDHKDK